MNKNIEIRHFETELRVQPDSRIIEGYALKFETKSQDLGGYVETINKNSLDGVIEKSNIFAYLNHNKERGVLARSRYGKGTLQLIIDEVGLFYRFEAPNTALGDEAIEMINRGDIFGSSFAFVVKKDALIKNADGTLTRQIIEFERLFDVSPVYEPAYLDTSAVLKRFADEEERETTINIVIQDNSTDNSTENEIDNSLNICTEDKETEPEPVEENPGTEEPTEPPANPIQEIKSVETQEIKNKNLKKNKMENFRLIDTIKNVVENRQLSDIQNAVIEKGRSEMRKSGQSFSGQIQLPLEYRATIAEGSGIGLETIATDKAQLELPLYANLALAKAGATTFSGLINNLSIPVYGGSSVTWAGETATASDGAGAFSQVDFSPKRLTATLAISKTLLVQDSAGVEAALLKDIVTAVNEKLEATILGTGAGDSNTPAGLFYNVTGTTSATYTGITATVATLENANVSNYQWIVNPTAKSIFKGMTMNGNTNVWMNNEIDGVPASSTSNVPSKGFIVGDFNQLVIAQFGSIDLTIDPYSLAANNQIKIVVNAYFDAKPLRANAFVKGYFA